MADGNVGTLVLSGVLVVLVLLIALLIFMAKPYVEAVPKLVKASEKASEAAILLATKVMNSLEIMMAIMNSYSLAVPRRRNVLLLIEDSQVEALAVQSGLLDVADRYACSIRHVSQLYFSLMDVPLARLAIIDMTLPDADHSTVLDFIRVCQIPKIIIYSADDWSKDVPPGVCCVQKPNLAELKLKVAKKLESIKFTA